MARYFDELEQARNALDTRYDKMKSGQVKGIPGEEAFARLKEKAEAAQRNRRQ